MDVFEEASAILRDWQVHNEPSPFSNMKENLYLEDTAWTASLATIDSPSALSQARGFSFSLQGLDPGENHFSQDAVSSSVDWERNILSEKHQRSGRGARINRKSELWAELEGGHQEEKEASPLGSERSSQAENRAPSRWQLLNSYVNKGQLPPPQLLSTGPDDKPKRYNPAQYTETLQSSSLKGRALERQTKASMAKHGQARVQEAKPGPNVKEYDPRLVMELRHQMVEDKRKKRALQKVDILAQGRAALAEARGGVHFVAQHSTVSSGGPSTTKHAAKDNRIDAYQKRKLAVQEEQQRLEAEVQRLREQIGADAETHRRARQNGAHGFENGNPASTEQEAVGCTSGASAGDDVSRSYDVSKRRSGSRMARGALTEIRNSNSQERQGPERPRSAGRVPQRQREGSQTTRERSGDGVNADGGGRNAAVGRAEGLEFAVRTSGIQSGAERDASATSQATIAAPGEEREYEPHDKDGVGDSLVEVRDEGRSKGQDSTLSSGGEEGSSKEREEGSVLVEEAGDRQAAAPPSSGDLSTNAEPAAESSLSGEASALVGTCGLLSKSAKETGKTTDDPSTSQTDEDCRVHATSAEIDESRGDGDAQAKDAPASLAFSERAERKLGSVQPMEAASAVAQQAESMARKRLALEEAAATALAAQQLEAAEALRDKELETTLELLLATKDKRALRQAWSTWRAAAVGARAPLQRAMIVLQWRRMTLIWRAWREEVQEGRDERTKELLEAELRTEASKRQRAVRHWRLRLLSQAFILWQDFSSKERLKKEVQAQHAARSHKMRALLSKQDALRLSLLWKDRKYRAGEVDAPSTDPQGFPPVEATGESDRCNYPASTTLLPPDVVSNESFVVNREDSGGGEDPFPVHLTEYFNEQDERGVHTVRAEAGGENVNGHQAVASARRIGASESTQAVQMGSVRGTEPGVGETDAALSNTPGFGSSLQESLGARARADEEESGDTSAFAFVPSQHHVDDENRGDEQGLLSAEGLGRGLDAGAQRADARKGGESENGDAVEKMEERAAARRRRRDELKRKYEEAQKRKEEEHAAAERLRAEAERLERAAALARKLEEARAKKQAEEAALQRKELAAQQMVLAKLHCKRQLMLRLGWRPWREVVDVARTRVLSSIAHHQRSLQRSTWHAWRAHVEAARDEREREESAREESAREHWRGRASARALAWWRLVRRARKQGHHNRLARALRCLQEAVAAARDRREDATAWWARSLQSRAWTGWRARAEEGRDVRLLKEVADAALADRFAHRSLLSRSFFDWIDAVGDAKVAAEKERQEEAMWAKINGWLADHRKGKLSSSTQGAPSRSGADE